MKSEVNERTETVFKQILEEIEYKGATVEKNFMDKPAPTGTISVSWKKNIRIMLYIRKYGNRYCVEKNGEQISESFYFRGFDDVFFKGYQKIINRVFNGDYDHKKTRREEIAETVSRRNLTSYMNNTKWREFLTVMTEKLPLAVPYDYKTLFQEEYKRLRLGTAYDIESFNGYDFKSLEWVKVKPKFYTHIHRGILVEDEKIFHDLESEFLEWMDKYSIPCEYDEKDEVYVIYGYK